MSGVIDCKRCGKSEVIQSFEEYVYKIKSKYYCSYTCFRAEGGGTGGTKLRGAHIPVNKPRKKPVANIALIEYRKKLGLSQTNLGKVLGLDASIIYKLEKGRQTCVTEKTVRKFVKTVEGREILNILKNEVVKCSS